VVRSRLASLPSFGGRAMSTIRAVVAVVIAACMADCAIQRAQIANDAQAKMIGLTKEQVLACMGPPSSKAVEGATEVWSYSSGNGRTGVAMTGNASHGSFVGGGVAESRFCTVNVTMIGGKVDRMNYIGPTGGLLSPNEQCAFAVANCMH
jgi:outer membrane protein assembly factor BamE (lipoprotein component of BamABCDE complex)